MVGKRSAEQELADPETAGDVIDLKAQWKTLPTGLIKDGSICGNVWTRVHRTTPAAPSNLCQFGTKTPVPQMSASSGSVILPQTVEHATQISNLHRSLVLRPRTWYCAGKRLRVVTVSSGQFVLRAAQESIVHRMDTQPSARTAAVCGTLGDHCAKKQSRRPRKCAPCICSMIQGFKDCMS